MAKGGSIPPLNRVPSEKKQTAQQRAWDFLGEIGVPPEKRSDGLKWCRKARPFMANREELAGFLRWMGTRMAHPWNPAQRFNLWNADGVESLKWQLAMYRGEKRRKPAAKKVDGAMREWMEGELERLAREAR